MQNDAGALVGMLEQIDLTADRNSSRYLQDSAKVAHPLRPVVSDEHGDEPAHENNDPSAGGQLAKRLGPLAIAGGDVELLVRRATSFHGCSCDPRPIPPSPPLDDSRCEARVTNYLYYGDNLDVLRESIPNESVDLIDLDRLQPQPLLQRPVQEQERLGCPSPD